MNKLTKLTLAASAVYLLSACGGGGGGGGGGGTSATLAPFISFSSMQPNTQVNIDGISQTGTYQYDVNASKVTALTISNSTSGSLYSTTFGADGLASSVTITPSGGNSVNWSRPADFFGVLRINQDINALISDDETRYAFAADPEGYGWDYQSFGIWTTGAGTGSGTYGAISAGAMTPGAAIPISGDATFRGISGGRYVDGQGNDFFTSSIMTAAANFSNRTIAFSTTESRQSADLLTETNNANLNMQGNLTYASNSNSITGNITTTGGLNGSVNARFYGPSAQEIGGTFAAGSNGIESFSGAFGGKQ